MNTAFAHAEEGEPAAESARTNFDLVAGQAACDPKLLRRILVGSPYVARTYRNASSASLQQLLDPESTGVSALTVPTPTCKLSDSTSMANAVQKVRERTEEVIAGTDPGELMIKVAKSIFATPTGDLRKTSVYMQLHRWLVQGSLEEDAGVTNGHCLPLGAVVDEAAGEADYISANSFTRRDLEGLIPGDQNRALRTTGRFVPPVRPLQQGVMSRAEVETAISAAVLHVHSPAAGILQVSSQFWLQLRVLDAARKGVIGVVAHILTQARDHPDSSLGSVVHTAAAFDASNLGELLDLCDKAKGDRPDSLANDLGHGDFLSRIPLSADGFTFTVTPNVMTTVIAAPMCLSHFVLYNVLLKYQRAAESADIALLGSRLLASAALSADQSRQITFADACAIAKERERLVALAADFADQRVQSALCMTMSVVSIGGLNTVVPTIGTQEQFIGQFLLDAYNRGELDKLGTHVDKQLTAAKINDELAARGSLTPAFAYQVVVTDGAFATLTRATERRL